MRKRYIFFDIDNTLTAGNLDNTVPASALLAIEKLREAGHFTAIATGRMHALSVPFLDMYGFQNMVSDGGYSVTLNGELQFLKPLDRDLCIRLVDECIEKDFIWALQVEDSDTRFAPDTRFEEFTRDVYAKTRVVPGLDPRNYDAVYKMYIACSPSRDHELETLQYLPWCRYSDTYFFVEPADKAFGIRYIMNHFGAKDQDVVVFGDGLNDLSMFMPEWTCVAMGNGAPELLARADYITAPSAEDGIYKACEALGLFVE